MKTIAWGGFFLLFFHTLPASAEPTIEVFTNEHYPVAGAESLRGRGIAVELYDLDAPKRWAAKMSQGLPGRREQAKAIVDSRFAQIGLEQVKENLKAAYQGLVKASGYGLQRYPAIVFDHGKSVVYGVQDLSRALSIYQQQNPGPHE